MSAVWPLVNSAAGVVEASLTAVFMELNDLETEPFVFLSGARASFLILRDGTKPKSRSWF